MAEIVVDLTTSFYTPPAFTDDPVKTPGRPFSTRIDGTVLNESLIRLSGTVEGFGADQLLFRGFWNDVTFRYDTAQLLVGYWAIHAQPIIQPTASGINETLAVGCGFISSPIYKPDISSGSTTSVGLNAYDAQPGATLANAGTATVTNLTCFASFTQLALANHIGSGITVPNLRHAWLKNPSVNAGATVTLQAGIDIEALTSGATNLSLRSAGTQHMRHEGGARFGSSSAGPRGSSILDIDGGLTLKRTTFSNADYTVLTTDLYIAQVGSMSAARTVTLPAAATAAAGTLYLIADESGSVTGTNKIIVARASSDTINGATSQDITSAYGFLRLISDGTSKWTML